MTDYIGARLSLVSKSDIRYVGILHEIDSVNSTVSLEQVRSFGTEGRKGDPALEIPASDNIFEYIIFRGSDVKDLRVEQGAGQPAPTPRQLPQDPAILQTGATPNSQRHAPPTHVHPGSRGGFDGPSYGVQQQQNYGYGYPSPPQQQYNGPPQPFGYPGQPTSSQPSFPLEQNQGIFAPQPQNAFPELPKSQQHNPSVNNSSGTKVEQQKFVGAKSSTAKVVPALPLPNLAASPKPRSQAKGVSDLTKEVDKLSTTDHQTSLASTNGSGQKRNALLEVSRNMKSQVTQPATQTEPAQPKQEASVENKPSSPSAARGRRSPNSSRRAENGGRQNGVIVKSGASIVIPDNEYDFSSANSKFSKEGLETAAPAVPVYDKKSSFFDQMSSEATDREANAGGAGRGRGRGREARNLERTMNYETFGEDLAFRSNTRGRGRGGRGGRGRGRGRGRGIAQEVQQ